MPSMDEMMPPDGTEGSTAPASPGAPEEAPSTRSPDELAPARDVVERELAATTPPAAPPVPTHESALAAGEPPRDERVVAALANLCSLASWTLAGLVVNALIFVVWRDRSPFVRFQAGQAMGWAVFSAVAVWLLGALIATVGALLWCLIPVFVVAMIALWVYPLWAAWQAFAGRNFHYPVVGPFVEGMLEP